ncbi:hypothetical protein Bhyg_08864 [Pseudolycoriella hygida]|uniref:Uncharacterized protein n=1 Tax=Pseudolycoriella hygida TaxID=35572 RepID=A0A9Q0N754_9DIPT|nr:hypothetical protein Bhyg_08864 [Pseudolycoriella hygida]
MKSLIFLFFIVFAFLVSVNADYEVVVIKENPKVVQDAHGTFYVENYPDDCLQDAGCLHISELPKDTKYSKCSYC